MQTHSLITGTPEWHAHRTTHFNASDSPAMTGCNPHKTRTQLLHELKTGLAPEVDSATQRRFDDGHRFEALARPIAEEIIGDDLAPVVGTLDELSASFDGLTLMSDRNWEHKTINDGIRASLPHAGRDSHKRNDGAMLGKLYRVQLEQQLMVSGAELALFSATRWEGDKLVEERHCWYFSDPKLRAEIIAGWKQFAIDLAAYMPPPVTVEAVGRTPETLPALHIVLKGEVSASNLAEFKEVALTAIRSVNRDLKTDQDFADSAKARKWCEDIEDRVAAAKDHALSQTASIDLLFRTMDEVSAEARDVRLALEKLEKARKEARRGEIVAGGITALREHIEALNARLGKPYMPTITADFGGAIKGLRTFDSMQNAVDTELARAKIDSSATADKIQANLTTLRELAAADHAFLFADTAQIVLKAPDDLTMLVKSRIAEHQASEEKKEAETRERIRAEEQAKAEKAAREQVEREQREAAAAAKPAQAIAEPVPPLQPIAAAQGGQDEFDNWRQGGTSAPVANVVPMRQAQPAAPATPPGMTLGAIGARLGFNLSADFLRNLGFEATKVKASCLYHEADFPLICAKLVTYIQGVQDKRAA